MSPSIDPSKTTKKLTVVFLALFAGQVLAFFVLGDFSKFNLDNLVFEDPDLYPVYGLFILINIIPLLVVKKMQKNAKEQPALSAKLEGYQSSRIVRWATLEGLFFACLILGGANTISLMMCGLALAIYLSTYPSKVKIIEDLSLSPEEIKAL